MSTEAEYFTLFEASKSIAWLREVLTELYILQAPTTVFQHNTGAIEMPQGGPAKHHVRRKHIDIWYNYVINKVESKDI